MSYQHKQNHVKLLHGPFSGAAFPWLSKHQAIEGLQGQRLGSPVKLCGQEMSPGSRSRSKWSWCFRLPGEGQRTGSLQVQDGCCLCVHVEECVEDG